MDPHMGKCTKQSDMVTASVITPWEEGEDFERDASRIQFHFIIKLAICEI
jgi:hypothetical protein